MFRIGRRGIQSSMGDARLYPVVPLLEGEQETTEHTTQCLPHLRHTAMVEYRQRYISFRSIIPKSSAQMRDRNSNNLTSFYHFFHHLFHVPNPIFINTHVERCFCRKSHIRNGNYMFRGPFFVD